MLRLTPLRKSMMAEDVGGELVAEADEEDPEMEASGRVRQSLKS